MISLSTDVKLTIQTTVARFMSYGYVRGAISSGTVNIRPF